MAGKPPGGSAAAVSKTKTRTNPFRAVRPRTRSPPTPSLHPPPLPQVLAGGSAAVVFDRFAGAVAAGAGLAEAAAASGSGDEEVVDYEAQEVAELLELCAERGMKRLPPMKRLIIEELRFFDVNGRQGVRNRGTRKLE